MLNITRVEVIKFRRGAEQQWFGGHDWKSEILQGKAPGFGWDQIHFYTNLTIAQIRERKQYPRRLRRKISESNLIHVIRQDLREWLGLRQTKENWIVKLAVVNNIPKITEKEEFYKIQIWTFMKFW